QPPSPLERQCTRPYYRTPSPSYFVITFFLGPNLCHMVSGIQTKNPQAPAVMIVMSRGKVWFVFLRSYVFAINVMMCSLLLSLVNVNCSRRETDNRHGENNEQ